MCCIVYESHIFAARNLLILTKSQIERPSLGWTRPGTLISFSRSRKTDDKHSKNSLSFYSRVFGGARYESDCMGGQSILSSWIRCCTPFNRTKWVTRHAVHSCEHFSEVVTIYMKLSAGIMNSSFVLVIEFSAKLLTMMCWSIYSSCCPWLLSWTALFECSCQFRSPCILICSSVSSSGSSWSFGRTMGRETLAHIQWSQNWKFIRLAAKRGMQAKNRFPESVYRRHLIVMENGWSKILGSVSINMSRTFCWIPSLGIAYKMGSLWRTKRL